MTWQTARWRWSPARRSLALLHTLHCWCLPLLFLAADLVVCPIGTISEWVSYPLLLRCTCEKSRVFLKQSWQIAAMFEAGCCAQFLFVMSKTRSCMDPFALHRSLCEEPNSALYMYARRQLRLVFSVFLSFQQMRQTNKFDCLLASMLVLAWT